MVDSRGRSGREVHARSASGARLRSKSGELGTRKCVVRARRRRACARQQRGQKKRTHPTCDHAVTLRRAADSTSAGGVVRDDTRGFGMSEGLRVRGRSSAQKARREKALNSTPLPVRPSKLLELRCGRWPSAMLCRCRPHCSMALERSLIDEDFPAKTLPLISFPLESKPPPRSARLPRGQDGHLGP